MRKSIVRILVSSTVLLVTLWLTLGAVGCSSDSPGRTVGPDPDPNPNPVVEEPSPPVTIGPGKSPGATADPHGSEGPDGF